MTKGLREFQEITIAKMIEKLDHHLELHRTAKLREMKDRHLGDAEFMLSVIQDTYVDYGWTQEAYEQFRGKSKETTEGDA